MLAAIVAIFVIGYLAIVFEHPLKLDKTVPALIMGALCWGVIALGHIDLVDHHGHIAGVGHGADGSGALMEHTTNVLLHHIGKVAEILLFLIGAMTIVELIDLHRGFSVITNRIKTTKKSTMLILISILAFFLSATLDNLAATIVLVSLLRKLVPNKTERIWFVSLAVIAANAGGAWSPIGDVTTTMLWIGGKVSTVGLIQNLVIPSVLCVAVPVGIALFLPAFRGNITPGDYDHEGKKEEEKLLSSRVMLITGVLALVFVPVFKSITHLPPYVGMMLSLGVVWLVSEFIHPEEDFDKETNNQYSAHKALSRIELSSILFFLGILVAVAALESVAVTLANGEHAGMLKSMAISLDAAIPNQDIVVMILGVLSAIIDNVPLVAASIGMYTNPIDAKLWHFIAFSAGTGGSMLIIGSAAGVAAMGMEKINFIWYLKKISWLAFLGFLAGCLGFLGIYSLMH